MAQRRERWPVVGPKGTNHRENGERLKTAARSIIAYAAPNPNTSANGKPVPLYIFKSFAELAAAYVDTSEAQQTDLKKLIDAIIRVEDIAKDTQNTMADIKYNNTGVHTGTERRGTGIASATGSGNGKSWTTSLSAITHDWELHSATHLHMGSQRAAS
jgi:hypothetical protein